MMSDKIEIVPYPINQNIDHIKVFVDNFQLNAIDCWCSVYEYDASEKLVNVHRVYIPPEEYRDWGKEDAYLVELVLDKLGYERRGCAELPDVLINFP